MNNMEEIRNQLNLRIQPLFSYWEMIDFQERHEINTESLLEINLKKKCFQLFLENHYIIRNLLDELEYSPIKSTLKLIYEKVHAETLKYFNQNFSKVDYTYDYYHLMLMFKKLLN